MFYLAFLCNENQSPPYESFLIQCFPYSVLLIFFLLIYVTALHNKKINIMCYEWFSHFYISSLQCANNILTGKITNKVNLLVFSLLVIPVCYFRYHFLPFYIKTFDFFLKFYDFAILDSRNPFFLIREKVRTVALHPSMGTVNNGRWCAPLCTLSWCSILSLWQEGISQ